MKRKATILEGEESKNEIGRLVACMNIAKACCRNTFVSRLIAL